MVSTGDILLDALISLIPPIMVGGLVYVLFRSIFRADQGARNTYQQIETEERAKMAKNADKTDGETSRESANPEAKSE